MTLRRFFNLSIALNTALVVVLALALIVSTSLLRKFTSVHERTLESIDAALNLELSLYEYNRLSNQFLLTGSPSALSERLPVRERIARGVESTVSNIDSEQERRLVGLASASIDAYFRRRDSVEANPTTYQADVAVTTELFEHSLSQVTQLVELNREQSRQADLKVSRLDLIANFFGSLFLFIVAALSLWAARASKRRIFTPLAETARGVARFPTDPATRLPVFGVKEIQSIAHEFNRMADQLAENRQRQLAFLAGVAHDLRNPLTAIRSRLELLHMRMPAPEAMPQTIEMLRRQVDRLNGMVQDLLDANRIEAGQLDVRLSWTDLQPLIHESLELFKPSAPHLNFDFAHPPHSVMVYCDAPRIVQVLNNLISNAVKFSPNGGTVKITLTETVGEIRLSIADQGVGIRAEEISHIFESFYRSPSVKGGISGVGLGLSITKKIIEAHGGTIAVESQYGTGTRFDISLPRGA